MSAADVGVGDLAREIQRALSATGLEHEANKWEAICMDMAQIMYDRGVRWYPVASRRSVFKLWLRGETPANDYRAI